MIPWGPLLAGTVLLGFTACGKDEQPAAPRVDPPVCAEPARAGAHVRRMSEVGGLSQCGLLQNFTAINSYQGEFADVAQTAEDAVVLINGNCTGTLIEASAGPVVLTAGHCVGLGDTSVLVFNFEDNPDGDPLIVEGQVIEQSVEPDYALIKPDTLPQVTPVQLTTRATERLAVIQHPRGRRKVIAEGDFLGSCNQLVYYGRLDTLVGSSGAGVLNRQGHLLGVHTDGDCDFYGHGNNRGWTAQSIVDASEYLRSDDIAER
jgi:trypsin-like peptidase